MSQLVPVSQWLCHPGQLHSGPGPPASRTHWPQSPTGDQPWPHPAVWSGWAQSPAVSERQRGSHMHRMRVTWQLQVLLAFQPQHVCVDLCVCVCVDEGWSVCKAASHARCSRVPAVLSPSGLCLHHTITAAPHTPTLSSDTAGLPTQQWVPQAASTLLTHTHTRTDLEPRDATKAAHKAKSSWYDEGQVQLHTSLGGSRPSSRRAGEAGSMVEGPGSGAQNNLLQQIPAGQDCKSEARAESDG